MVTCRDVAVMVASLQRNRHDRFPSQVIQSHAATYHGSAENLISTYEVRENPTAKFGRASPPDGAAVSSPTTNIKVAAQSPSSQECAVVLGPDISGVPTSLRRGDWGKLDRVGALLFCDLYVSKGR